MRKSTSAPMQKAVSAIIIIIMFLILMALLVLPPLLGGQKIGWWTEPPRLVEGQADGCYQLRLTSGNETVCAVACGPGYTNPIPCSWWGKPVRVERKQYPDEKIP